MKNLKKIFLTGAGGMVGQNILAHPDITEWEILSPRSHELDLQDNAAVDQFFSIHQPDLVIHAAGRVGGIQANIANPVDFLVTNTDIARNVILAARKHDVKNFLNLGSSCIYPRKAKNPLTEDLILQGELEPTNEAYALAKIFALRLCQYIRKETPSFQYKTLIPCNLYGPYDKFSPTHSHLVPSIIHKIHQAKEEKLSSVEIWGDGHARREFMYAADLADAIIYAVQHFEQLPNTMNIGLGKDYSINEYYTAIAKIVGWQGSFKHDHSKPVGMQQKLVSIEKQLTFGWRAQTSLSEGLSQTYQYYLREYPYE